MITEVFNREVNIISINPLTLSIVIFIFKNLLNWFKSENKGKHPRDRIRIVGLKEDDCLGTNFNTID